MSLGFSIAPMGSQNDAFGLTPDMLATIRQMATAAPAAPSPDPAAVPAPAGGQPAGGAPFGLAPPAAARQPVAPDAGMVSLPAISVTAPQQPTAGGAGAQQGNAGGPMTDQQALAASAQRLGLSPVEWGGIIHYESGGDPSRWGGAGGRHVGLIQFGPNEQKQFGVTGRESFQEQLLKAEQFMSARGYKPGMGVMNAYSTINAGSPGRFNASDAGNGGLPGTVADKVNTQFAPHYAWANKFLGGGMQLPNSAGGSSRPAAFGLSGPTQAGGTGTVLPAGGGDMSAPSVPMSPDATSSAAASPGAPGTEQSQGGGSGKGGQKQGSGGAQAMQFRTVRPRPFAFMHPMQFAGLTRDNK